mmetsp:Transcript_120570/g.336407  ORF Transcript_120570/g.336407 Transcript_120570/m.336407 type:complete len:187 (+) Transcript_120570:114-674(+)
MEEVAGTDDLRVNFLFREKARSLIKDEGRLIAARCGKEQRTTVTYTEPGLSKYTAHAWVHQGFAAVAFADEAYPARVAFGLLGEALRPLHAEGAAPGAAEATVEAVFRRFQDPKQADALTRVQGDLQEVQGLVTKTMDELLKRGESIGTLCDKSGRLLEASQQFKRTAARNNSLCAWLQSLLANAA